MFSIYYNHYFFYIQQIIPLKKVRSQFKTFERKKQLASMYDIFLADHRILQILYNKLGKAFISKKGFPYLVNLCKKDLKSEFQTVLSSTYYRASESKSLSLKIGRLSMTSEEVVENIIATTRGVAQKIPKGWHNIQSLNIKTADSTALPIFDSLTVEPSKLPLTV